jgi:starch phosphorylase
MGQAQPKDLRVELYAGRIDQKGQIVDGAALPMVAEDGTSGGEAWYRGTLRLESSGRRGFTVRVVPAHPHQADFPEPGMIRWASS